MSTATGKPPIETSELSIATATITIRALHVNNRQMTQAVFTQLPKAALIESTDEDYEDLDEYRLAGNVWGWVNFSPKGDDPEQRQFIADIDGRLYRCPSRVGNIMIYHPETWDDRVREDCQYLAIDYLGDVAMAILARLARSPESGPRSDPRDTGFPLGDFPPLGRVRVRALYNDRIEYVAGHADIILKSSFDDRQLAHLLQRWRGGSIRHTPVPEKVPDEDCARTRAVERAASIGEHIRKMNAIREQLRFVEQLFIAT
jgi:hypothetical protein